MFLMILYNFHETIELLDTFERKKYINRSLMHLSCDSRVVSSSVECNPILKMICVQALRNVINHEMFTHFCRFLVST